MLSEASQGLKTGAFGQIFCFVSYYESTLLNGGIPRLNLFAVSFKTGSECHDGNSFFTLRGKNNHVKFMMARMF
jgi:hypothetical protein